MKTMMVRFVLRNCQNKRYWKHKQERWYPFTTDVNDAKWFGTWEAAEKHRVTREEPTKWEVVRLCIEEEGREETVSTFANLGPGTNADLINSLPHTIASNPCPVPTTFENPQERLQECIRQCYPNLNWVAARNWAQEIDIYAAQQEAADDDDDGGIDWGDTEVGK